MHKMPQPHMFQVFNMKNMKNLVNKKYNPGIFFEFIYMLFVAA